MMNGTINVMKTGKIVNNGFFQNNEHCVINIHLPGEFTGNAVNGAGRIVIIEQGPDLPVLTATVFDEDWRDSINIRFFLDGELSELPLENIELIVDGAAAENIRDYTVNVANWQTAASAVFISKTKTNWEQMTINITAHGQTLTYNYVNTFYVPETQSFDIEEDLVA
jgi:hypothetical protein